jgi:inhibitor of cysteine peptidase
MSEIVVTQGEHGRTVAAAAGDRIKIELPENPTTGFRWQGGADNASVLRLESDDFIPGGGTVGAGGLRTFRFLAAGSGSADILLELKRAWESQPARSTFAIRVSVT